MSRTHHHRNKGRRIVKGSYYKKILHIWGEDFSSKKGKKRWLNRLARKRQKEKEKKLY